MGKARGRNGGQGGKQGANFCRRWSGQETKLTAGDWQEGREEKCLQAPRGQRPGDVRNLGASRPGGGLHRVRAARGQLSPA